MTHTFIMEINIIVHQIYNKNIFKM